MCYTGDVKTIFDGREYEILLGSDVQNDGMFLEMNDLSGNVPDTVLFAFRSDIDGRVTLSAYREDLPLDAVAWFVQRARETLT
jgi:hypothetical protein